MIIRNTHYLENKIFLLLILKLQDMKAQKEVTFGIITLHEISHKYNDLEDQDIIYGVPGPNEEVINNIRTELDASGDFKLPFGQRKSYSPKEVGDIKFSPFSSEAYQKGPFKVDPKKDLYIKTHKK